MTTVDTGLKVGLRRVITIRLCSQDNLSYRFDFSTKRGKLFMKKALIVLLSSFILWTAVPLVSSEPQTKAVPGYLVERDANVAKNEPGPHDGGGPSTGYVFFEKAPDLKFSFRKRVLHRGAAIGYHLQKTDEVYYITGGSSHGLAQKGATDLTIIISFQKE